MTKYFYHWAIAISLAAPVCAASPDNLLERTGQRVKLFWDQFSAVTCTEELMQEKLDEKGKPTLRNQSHYDYLIALSWDRGELLVDESRVENDPPRKRRPEGSLLATRGFATLMFILHPDFQSSYAFTAPVEEPGASALRVDFLPRPGARSPAVLELKGREYPIPWEGSAWIDPVTAAVTRIEARWKEPPEALGLKSLESDVRYGSEVLRGGQSYWLPQAAHVSLQSRHQTWRNEHRFTKYRLFSVDVKDEVEQPK
jgi:hypothetical protein